jgi:hypothetical protein
MLSESFVLSLAHPNMFSPLGYSVFGSATYHSVNVKMAQVPATNDLDWLGDLYRILDRR